jgi:23S rRNA pseudouridine2605 synthase
VKGVMVEGERLKVERAALINPRPDGTANDLDVHMHHGKKREIRQLFTALRHEVRRLRRYQIGSIRLKGIPLRAAKQLSTKEISLLFHSPRTPRAELQATAPHAFNNDEN